MNIKLSNRLAAVAKMVIPGKMTADIGTDHGYLPVYLVVNGIVPAVIATDRARIPLQSAEQLVSLLSLEKKIDLRLGDGLSVLHPGEVSTVCISGIGGVTIRSILEAEPEVLSRLERLVLQPQRGAAGLRHWLSEHGWRIIHEDIAYDDGFYYEIITAQPGVMTLSREEEEFGPLLMAEGHPLFADYLRLKQADIERLLAEVSKSNNEEAAARAEQLRAILERIKKVIG